MHSQGQEPLEQRPGSEFNLHLLQIYTEYIASDTVYIYNVYILSIYIYSLYIYTQYIHSYISFYMSKSL